MSDSKGTAAAAWHKRRWVRGLAVLGVLLVLGAFYGWYKFFREVQQPDWVTATPESRWRYGSIGGERDAGTAMTVASM